MGKWKSSQRDSNTKIINGENSNLRIKNSADTLHKFFIQREENSKFILIRLLTRQLGIDEKTQDDISSYRSRSLGDKN